MRKYLIIVIGVVLWFGMKSMDGFSQSKSLNISGLHQLVADSKSEYELQNESRNRQAVTTGNEQANKTMLARLKFKYRQLQERYHSLGTILDVANVGMQASPMLSRIIQNQAGIYAIARKNPTFLSIAYQAELEFAEKGRSLFNFLSGLCVSIGPLNQMKVADRKILFDHVLVELSNLQDMSFSLLCNMQYAQGMGLARSMNPFQNYIDQDKEIIKDIMRNAGFLK